MLVRNKRTGVVTEYPLKQARWLINTGNCEEVKPEKKAEVKKIDEPDTKQTYQTKDLKADVAISKKKAKSAK